MHYEVTIGIPVYKAVDYIEETMRSALAQTFSSIEFLVVDDGGEDSSIEIVERLRDEHPRGNAIRILYNNRNYGVGVTRNRILDEAIGKYLFFLDSDDIIEPDTIQSLVDKMKENEADVVYGSLDRIDLVNGTHTQSYILPNISLLSDDEMAFYVFRNYSSFQISVCNCLLDLDFIRSNQLRFMDAVFWEDLAFTYEMAIKVRRAIFLPKITYHYLCRSGSLSHYQDRELLNKSEIMENVAVLDYLKEKCRLISDKPYLPYLCYNLEMNSFYVLCYIIKYYKRISPKVTYQEMRKIISHPFGLSDIMLFRHKHIQNLFFGILTYLPSTLSIFIVRVVRIIKKTL